jgi:hypothetical protein
LSAGWEFVRTCPARDGLRLQLGHTIVPSSAPFATRKEVVASGRLLWTDRLRSDSATADVREPFVRATQTHPMVPEHDRPYDRGWLGLRVGSGLVACLRSGG